VSVTPIWAKGVAQGTISDTYSNHMGAHHEIYKTTWVYIGKKKLCLSNKTFGHFFRLYQLAKHVILCFQLLHITDYVLFFVFFTFFFFFLFFFLFFYEGFNSCRHVILMHERHTCYLWFKTGIPNILNIICV
jgi:hypothetical protein